MPFDVATWSSTWTTLLIALAVPLTIWAWFLADAPATEDENATDWLPAELNQSRAEPC
jgi:hypothetical protein